MHPFITVSLKMMKKESPKMAFADITGAKVEKIKIILVRSDFDIISESDLLNFCP